MATATIPNNRRGAVTLDAPAPEPPPTHDNAALLQQVLQQPRYSVADVETMSKQVTKSGFGGLTEAQAFTLMMVCEADGLHPIQAIRRFHVIKGRPAMRADAILADMLRLGWSVAWTTELDDREVQEAFFRHKTKCPDGKAVRFSFEDAKKAKVSGNDSWQNWTPAMLRARVSTIACRALDPGIIVGLYSVEEVEDMRPSPEAERLQSGLRTVLDEAKRGATTEGQPASVPAPPPSEFAAWVEGVLAATNGQWLEMCEFYHHPYKPVVNRHQLTNHLMKSWLASGRITPDQIQDDAGKRDNAKAAAAFRAVWDADTPAVQQEIRIYLGNKLGETVKEANFPANTPDAALAEGDPDPDGDWPEDRE